MRDKEHPSGGAEAAGRIADVPPEIVEYALSALSRAGRLAVELAGRVIAGDTDAVVGTLVSREEIGESCRDGLRGFYRYLAGLAPLDRAAVRALGRRRAEQGVPLSAVLRHYRIAARFAWENLAGHVEPTDGRTVGILTEQVDLLWRLLDIHSGELRAGYGEVAAVRARQARSRLHRRVDALIGDPDDPGDFGDLGDLGDLDGLGAKAEADIGPDRRLGAADALGLPHRGRFQVAVVQGAGPGEQRSWEADWAGRGITSVWRVDTGELTAVLCLGRHAVAAVLGGSGGARAGLSPVFERVTDAGQATRHARLALATLPAGAAGTSRYGADPVAVLVADARRTSRDLADRVLGEVLRLAEHERAALLETLNAWFAAGGSTVRAAAALYCHRNTVRYRLRRVEELTGLRTGDPRAAAQLYLALQAVAQFGTGRRD